MIAWGDVLLSGQHWYRRWRGGHWENWGIGTPVNGMCWMRVDGCSRRTRYRPGLGQYISRCEDYTTAGQAVQI